MDLEIPPPEQVPYGMRAMKTVALADGEAGLGQFTEQRIADRAVTDLAAKVHYETDPDNEYPRNYTGHLVVTLDDGSRLTANQPCLRGGRGAPLSDAEITRKFYANTAFGGWTNDRAEALAAYCSGLFDRDDLKELRSFSG